MLYRGSETAVLDQADTFGGFALPAMEIALDPGESMVFPSRPVVDVREALGAGFAAGRYLVAAKAGLHAFRPDGCTRLT